MLLLVVFGVGVCTIRNSWLLGNVILGKRSTWAIFVTQRRITRKARCLSSTAAARLLNVYICSVISSLAVVREGVVLLRAPLVATE